METIFIEAKYNSKIRLNESILNSLKKYRKIALYTSIQFIDSIQSIKNQLKNKKITVLTSKPSRTNKESQILGCDCYYENLKLKQSPDAFLYIGDGMFHPQAIALAQKESKEFKEIIRYDPISDSIQIIKKNEIKRMLLKYKSSLMKFLTAKSIGILITTKPGQNQYELARSIEKKYPKKQFYYFLDNSIDLSQFENFNFIDVWVNSACPRIGFDDSLNTIKPLININDMLNAHEKLSISHLFA